MMLQDVQSYLATGMPTVTVKYGFMPKAPTEVLALYAYAGEPPEYTHDGARVSKPGLQLVARSATYAGAHSRLKAAQVLLEAVINDTVGGSFYRRILPRQEPFALPGWQDDVVILAQNYAVEQVEA